MEIGDPGKSFVWSTVATGTNRYEVPYSPIHGLTLAVFVDGSDVSNAVEAEEHTGIITFDTPPDAGLTITVQGTYYRFFTDTELEGLTDAAVQEHLYLRTDAFGRALNVGNLPIVEEYPASILATIQALYTLATDASFDIDIQTPDGVSIPRSERYRQLMEMITARKAQYDDLCKALNIGLTRIDVFSFRRISKATNRYVPVYMPQEIDDRTPPSRIYLPIPTYGGSPVPSAAAPYDLVFTQGDDFSIDIDFPFDLSLYAVAAQIRLFPESAAIVATPTLTPVDTPAGTLRLSLTGAQTTRVPLKAYWDLQVTGPSPSEFTETYVNGLVFCKRQVTREQDITSNPSWSPTGWEP
jgi:hypothetical protein